MKKFILILALMSVMAGIAWAGCQVDWECARSCHDAGNSWSKCERWCTFCDAD